MRFSILIIKDISLYIKIIIYYRKKKLANVFSIYDIN